MISADDFFFMKKRDFSDICIDHDTGNNAMIRIRFRHKKGQ